MRVINRPPSIILSRIFLAVQSVKTSIVAAVQSIRFEAVIVASTLSTIQALVIPDNVNLFPVSWDLDNPTCLDSRGSEFELDFGQHINHHVA